MMTPSKPTPAEVKKLQDICAVMRHMLTHRVPKLEPQARELITTAYGAAKAVKEYFDQTAEWPKPVKYGFRKDDGTIAPFETENKDEALIICRVTGYELVVVEAM